MATKIATDFTDKEGLKKLKGELQTFATDYTDKEGYYVEKTLRITAKIATDLTDKDGLKKRLKGKLLPRISRIRTGTDLKGFAGWLQKLATDITDKDGLRFLPLVEMTSC